MTIEMVTQTIDVWIARYVALFCLTSIIIWCGSAYFMRAKWMKTLRDSTVYFCAIGGLALVLALRPVKQDVLLWTPVAWFCFAMLLVLELLWISYLLDGLMRIVHGWITHVRRATEPPSRPLQGYSRR